MFGFRFSLAQLAIAMVIVGMGFAAIVSANTIVASLSLTVFFIANLVAVTGSLTTSGAARAFWIGMAVFGWAYWWQHEPTLLREDQSNRYGYGYGGYTNWYSGGIMAYGGDQRSSAPKLSTEWLLDRLYVLSARSPKVGEKVIARWMGGSFFPGTVLEIGNGDFVVKWDDGSQPTAVAARDVHNEGAGFYVTGHSVFGVLFGLIGGILGLAFFGPKPEETSTPAATPPAATPAPAAPPTT